MNREERCKVPDIRRERKPGRHQQDEFWPQAYVARLPQVAASAEKVADLFLFAATMTQRNSERTSLLSEGSWCALQRS